MNDSVDVDDSNLLQALAARFDVAALERHAGAIFVVAPDWRLRYMNAAWQRFAAENDGEPGISTRFPRGSSLLDAFASDRLRDYYSRHYAACRQRGKIWWHEYDCSSPDTPRRFQQLVYPLADGNLLVVNSRLIAPARRAAADALTATLASYRDARGLIHQCAHCRRVHVASEDDCWDWVPRWARHIPRSASHTFCPTCVGFFYPPLQTR